MNEHEEEIESVDVHWDKGLILTASKDGYVKIWNTRKEIIREIKFNEDINQALFLNNLGDVIVAHGSGQISVINAVDYQPFELALPSNDLVHGKF
jgi:WD40 repeat protein